MSYSFIDAYGFGQGGQSYYAQTIGPSGTGFCVLLLQAGNASAAPGVAVGTNTALSCPYWNATYGFGIYYGSLLSSATVVNFTGLTSYNNAGFGIWTWPGSGTFNTHTYSATGGSSGSGDIAVTAGDYVFAIANAVAEGDNFSASTTAPTNAGPGSPYWVYTGAIYPIFADWSIASSGTLGVQDISGDHLIVADFTPSGGSPAPSLMPQALLRTWPGKVFEPMRKLLKPRRPRLLLPEPAFVM
jgi:hypothetical protein